MTTCQPYTGKPALVITNSEIIVFIQHPVTLHSSVIDIGRYFFNLFYMSMWYNVTVPTLEFDYLYYINFLFNPVTVSFYFCSMAKLHFVNYYTDKRI